MYYIPTSYLVLFSFFALFHHLSSASSESEPGWCKAQFQCGHITAGFPFSGLDSPEVCGHPSLELHCYNNTASIIISNHFYNVLHIDQKSNTLRLSRAELEGSFCNATFTATTLPTNLFKILPTYKSLNVFYLCNPNNSYRSSHTCPNSGPVSVSQTLDYRRSCQGSFKINVPKSYVLEEKELNVTHLESALREGFEVKVKIDEKACQKCLSSNGTCGIDKSKMICCKEASSSECKTILHIPTDKGLSTAAKAGIAIAGVGFLLFIAAGLLCIARWRNKTQDAQYTSKDLPIMSYSSIAAGLGMVGKWARKTSDDLEQKYLKSLIPLKHYSYAQVKRISKSFTEEVGKGGFGTVYRGTLCDGRIVAVKILKDSMGNGEDFINEVASISKTSHVNIVSLLGFCSEGSKRAIIYEYLENGSLDQYISKNASLKMDWMEMYRITLGVARGLEYLHHGCKTRIVHFDIKPQNVLLDDNLCPKVSDFGLAKLCEKKESILSLLDARGTIGYIAPEVFSRMYGRVSHKSDVYSYGMLVLEMIGAREKTSTENSVSNPSSMYFPEWIYREFEKGDNGRLYGNGITCEEEEIAKKMKLVGLWCVQPSPSDRPSMNRVVEMMEGNLSALKIPPRPGLQIPAAPLVESSRVSEDISIYTEV